MRRREEKKNPNGITMSKRAERAGGAESTLGNGMTAIVDFGRVITITQSPYS